MIIAKHVEIDWNDVKIRHIQTLEAESDCSADALQKGVRGNHGEEMNQAQKHESE